MVIKIDSKNYEFISLSKAFLKRSKSKRFREAYDAEMARLKLAHDIKLLRRKKKMTQREVALRAAMPQSVVARIESGSHSVSVLTLHRIARVFDKEVGFVAQTR